MSKRSALTYIYALVDPTTLLVRYVGKTNSPHSRLRAHTSAKSLESPSHKNNWIKSLLAKRLMPIMVILQVVPFDNWAEAERAWIVQFRMIGANLTNFSDGGEGVLEPTPETITRKRPRPRPPAKVYPKKKRLIPKKKIKP
jgi:hypothetical protein